MTTQVPYNDSVEHDAGAHTADSLADNGDTKAEAPLRHMGPARTEFAGPGHAGRSESTTPIGPQSGHAPLGSEEAPHGDGTYTSDDELRRDWGAGY